MSWNSKNNWIAIRIIILMQLTSFGSLELINQNNNNPLELSANVILFDKHSLQLHIKWNTKILNGRQIDIVIKPNTTLDKDGYCGDRSCFKYGISEDFSEVSLPEDTMTHIEHKECAIKPGCTYDIRAQSPNNHLFSTIQYQLPDCIYEICSCSHDNMLPNTTIRAIIESSNVITVYWNITPNFYLPNKITAESITISMGKPEIPALKWGGNNELIEKTMVKLKNTNGEFMLNGTTKINLYTPLVGGSTFLLRAFVVDNRGCSGHEGRCNINVPEVARNNTIKSAETQMWILGIIVPISITFLLIIIFIPRIVRKIRKKYEEPNWRGVYHNIPNSVAPHIMMEDNFLYVDKDILEARAKGEADLLEVPHCSLHLGSEIGKGAFGRVLIARADNLCGKPGKQLVAVKQLKKRPNADELEEFLGEIATMKKVGRHPNIVNLLGCCTIRQPLLMIMEYVGCGDLLQYLRKIRAKHEERSACVSGIGKLSITDNNINIHSHNIGKYSEILHSSSSNSDASYITQPDSVPSALRPSVTDTMYTILSRTVEGSISSTSNSLEYVLDHNELHMFAVQISRGMRHLEDKQITHRDLAARNILIDEHKNLKISDFGLSRSGIYVNTRNKKVPLRWLSIEAMRDNLYSSKSDVWALGIVLWEIGTLGGYPYPTVGNHELLTFLSTGERLQRPENCSKHLYEVMLHCWSEKPEDRPSFAELVTKLEPQQQKIYIDFDELGPDYVFPPTFEKK